MILLILLYLSLGSSFALPAPSDLPTNIPPSLFTRNPDIFGTRSIWGIIWSCLSTLFACTWIAVHPNIPGPKDSRWVVLRTRLAIMAYTLIAPEMVIFWATKQHIGARRIAKQYGWTRAHGFFLIMGGFTLHDERGMALRILLPKELEELSKAGKIVWPSITEEEIQDRSKGDYLSKGIILLQTSWFITQCIVRRAYQLEITELEVATLAFAVLTGVTYYLWWDKPLDVRCSVPVYLLRVQDLNQVLADSQSPLHEEIQFRQQPRVVFPNNKPNPREPNSSTISGSNFTRMQRFSASIQRRRQKHGTFLGLFHIFLLDPLRGLFGAFFDMAVSETLHNSSPLRVPTFHAPHDSYNLSTWIALPVAFIFGRVHCIAWSFRFPTLQERLAWRISAAFVFAFPFSFIPLGILMGLLEPFVHFVGRSTKLGKFLYVFPGYTGILLMVIYVVARMALLILPCIALRALPPPAFVDIQWTSFFPHIG